MRVVSDRYSMAMCTLNGVAMPKKATSARRRRVARRPRRGPKRATPKRATPKRATPSRAALEATLAALAHDIRTPLTGILALGELLATSDLDERERGWATAIKGTAEHLAMLTSLIVDAARAESKGLVLRRVAFRPRQLVDALAASLVARAGAKSLTSEVVVAP